MKTHARIACLLFAAAAALSAQQIGTKFYLALMQPQNEVPPVTDTSSASALIMIHGMLDSSGNVVSGSVDFDIETRFSGAVTITGLHIHNAAAGTAGPIVIPTDINGSDNSIAVDVNGRVRIRKQVQFPSAAVTTAAIQDLLAHPQNYYVNLHTSANPAGAMRGQLVPADSTVVAGTMTAANEVPPTSAKGSALASVAVFRGTDANGNVQLAAALFNVDYSGFDPGTMFTGMHIHNGKAGSNGPVVINTGISAANPVTVDSSGGGNLNFLVPMSPLDANFATETATVNSLFLTPANQYINLHTQAFPGGAVRDQLHSLESVPFYITNLSPANETPAVTGTNAGGFGVVNLLVARGPDGSARGGAVIFDMNYRNLGANSTVTGMHIHQGAPGSSGNIVVSSGVDANTNKVVSDTGNGNIFRIVNVGSDAGIAALNGILTNPNAYYVNLHTTANPAGLMREQLGPALAKPAIGGIAANASTITTAAPGSIIAIYGTALSPVESGLGGFGNISALATSMDGVTVSIGGAKAPFYYVGPSQINAQVPFETAAGQQQVVVTTAAGSATSSLTVAAQAPSIFILDANGTGAVVKNSDFSLVTSSNPAKAGDTLVIYLTGMGQTTPPIQTGALVQPPSGAFNNTAPATVTIGGQNAPVVYSIASPGFAGLYQIAVTVPSGVSGHVPVTITAGGAQSNSPNIDVR